jgi:protein transport protein SEC61 subunit alpha
LDGEPNSRELTLLYSIVFARSDPRRALRDVFWRERLPNGMILISTIIIFAAVIYLQGFRIEIPRATGLGAC